jgi:hypothetical protein
MPLTVSHPGHCLTASNFPTDPLRAREVILLAGRSGQRSNLVMGTKTTFVCDCWLRESDNNLGWARVHINGASSGKQLMPDDDRDLCEIGARSDAVARTVAVPLRTAGGSRFSICSYGPLNRTILLDVDHFATPVAADLFSLRALSTVGRSLGRWIKDWKTVRGLAGITERKTLLEGKPEYLGYITSSYKVSSGRVATLPHEYWEAKIAPRVSSKIVADLRAVDPALVPHGSNKIGVVKNFQSLSPQAQHLGLAIGKLKGHASSGYYSQIEEAASEFDDLTREIVKRVGLKIP